MEFQVIPREQRTSSCCTDFAEPDAKPQGFTRKVNPAAAIPAAFQRYT